MDIYDPAPAELLLKRHRRLDYPFPCEFGGARLLITDGVFCPTLTNASPLLLSAVRFASGQRVLDVFSGSGAFAVVAALAGAQAVAVDISPLAGACAATNAKLNEVQEAVDVRIGILETCVAKTEQFDLIVANPPLLPYDSGDLGSDLEAAVYDPGFRATLAFFKEVGPHLEQDGRCYVVTSNVLDRAGYDVGRLCFDNALTADLVTKLDVGYETYRVHELRHSE